MLGSVGMPVNASIIKYASVQLYIKYGMQVYVKYGVSTNFSIANAFQYKV